MYIEVFFRYAAVILSFVAALLFVIGVASFLSRNIANRRLGQFSRIGSMRGAQRKTLIGGSSWLDRITERVSAMSAPKEGSVNYQKQNLKFLCAGIRDPRQIHLFQIWRSVLALGLPTVVVLWILASTEDPSASKLFSLATVAAAAGYYLPEFYLRRKTYSRQKVIQNGLPDLLDLMVICTEAGLGLDSATQRISKEMVYSNPALADELQQMALEIRAGSGRDVAFKNLSERIKLDDIQSLVSILSQADQFGTSIAESFRVLSDMMRVKRMQRAEEIAAKTPTKMLFPLVVFIFPAFMIVLIGPGAIKVMEAFAK